MRCAVVKSPRRNHVHRKGINPVEALPTARLVLATNNRPRFSDRSGGLWRRMLLMPFRVEIQTGERVYGMDKPAWWKDAGELPGIFNWAVEGLRRLRQQTRFTEATVCQNALAQYQAECNPARLFLTERCTASADQIPTEQLFDHYRDWCQRNGYHPLASTAFGKEVMRVYPNVRKRKLGQRDSRLRVYEGIRYSGVDAALWPLPPETQQTPSAAVLWSTRRG